MGGIGHPLVCFLAFTHITTIPMIGCLLAQHLNMIFRNLTTNEMINMGRYDHFWIHITSANGVSRRVFHNPFDKGGLAANWLDFWWTRKRGEFGPDRTPCCAESACGCH